MSLKINSFLPVDIVSGKNCLFENQNKLVSLGSRCLIVTGKTSARSSGALDDVLSILDSSEIDYAIFDKIEPNPLTSTCKAAGDMAKSFGADFVIGIGGGSVLDASKAVAIYCCNDSFSPLDIYDRSIPAKKIPVVLIGTTSGTGSEVTGVSVLTNHQNGLKKSISGRDCYADISFCDYTYTKSTNTEIRISTALDALAHAVEAYFASSSNALVELYSLEAIRLLSKYVLSSDFDCLSDHDFEKLYIASLYAGMAINIAGTCFPHTVGYYLTENHGIPHGRACAVFMPEFLRRAKKYRPEKIEAMENALSTDINSFLEAVIRLNSIKLDLDNTEVNSLAERWKNGVKNFDRTPGGFSAEDAVNALKSLI